MRSLLRTLALGLLLAWSCGAAHGDPLASWNEGLTRQSIVEFVQRVTDPQGKDFVPAPQRVAVFDNDGTLWVEQPVYTELAFALARVRELAPAHPDWQAHPALKAAIDGDFAALKAMGSRGLVEIVMVTHAGMSPEAFDRIVTEWLATAEHPRFRRRYTELVYQPMLELMTYLRQNGFTTYIVSGGGVEFMRPWSARVYGVPPPQVVGSSIKTQFEIADGKPRLLRLPEVNFIDDGPGKPAGISEYIGLRPIAAFGNSDGDLQMLQWTTAGSGVRFGLIVHHTDGVREYAYDRDSDFGRLDKALDAARANGWTVVDMKKDWSTIFPPTR
jgi:hypothetical protein